MVPLFPVSFAKPSLRAVIPWAAAGNWAVAFSREARLVWREVIPFFTPDAPALIFCRFSISVSRGSVDIFSEASLTPEAMAESVLIWVSTFRGSTDIPSRSLPIPDRVSVLIPERSRLISAVPRSETGSVSMPETFLSFRLSIFAWVSSISLSSLLIWSLKLTSSVWASSRAFLADSSCFFASLSPETVSSIPLLQSPAALLIFSSASESFLFPEAIS